MPSDITRRDFLNGAAVAVASGLLPGRSLAAAGDVPYPPALTGLRGSHDGAFETAHSMVFDGAGFDISGLPDEAQVDLVVIGAGISGLSAAWFYRNRFGPEARILILDNHDDFGGHAKRNEFTVDGRLLIGYGGSESLQSPKHYFSGTVLRLLGAIGVDIDRLADCFDRGLYRNLGLGRAIFFDRETFGADKLVAGDPTVWVSDDTEPGARVERPLADFLADFPMSAAARAELLALHTERRVTLGHLPPDERIRYLRQTGYVDFLRRDWGLGQEALGYFKQRTVDFFGVPPDFVSAWDAWQAGYPGCDGIDLALKPDPDSVAEPYVHHFPDGNASIARLLVRSLIPDAVPGRAMEDVVLARLGYERLDREGSPVRIRLGATAVRVENTGRGVAVGYVKDGALCRVAARDCVLAGWHMMIPHIVPELPPDQRAALARNVKMPLVYANVAVRNWQAFVALGVHDVYAPGSFFARTKLDYPVSMGGYGFPSDPAEPMLLHLVHVPTEPDGTADPRDAFRAARHKLLATPFADFETAIRGQLDRMLGAGGFDAGRDIRAITVNRWSHGYSNWVNTLVDDPDEMQALMRLASRPVGRIAIANSDRRWDAYAHAAIDAAADAVAELAAG